MTDTGHGTSRIKDCVQRRFQNLALSSLKVHLALVRAFQLWLLQRGCVQPCFRCPLHDRNNP